MILETELPQTIAAVLARFSGAVVVGVRTTAEAKANRSAEVAHREALRPSFQQQTREAAWRRDRKLQDFSVVAPKALANGWSLFGQRRDGRRGPILLLAGGRSRMAMQWRPYIDARPSLDDVQHMAASDPSCNTAVVMGPGSGDAVALDVDVGTAAQAETVLRLADEHLGRSEFRRIGRAPRIVLLYRQDPADPVKTRAYRVEGLDGLGETQAIEVLARGKPVTAFGQHHRTGEVFRWIGAMRPDTHGPEHAPLLSDARLQAFLSAVDTAGVRIPGLRNVLDGAGQGLHIDPALVTESGFVRPGLSRGMGGVTWDASGKVIDGREGYIHSRAYAYVARNPGMTLSPEGCHVLAAELKSDCERTFATLGTRFASHDALIRACRERIDSAARKLARGEIEARGVVRDEATGRVTATVADPIAVRRDEGDDLAWLPKKRALLPKDVTRTKPDPARAAERALITDADRDVQAVEVATAIVTTLTDFMTSVRRDRAGLEDAELPVELLKAPTGAGKTSTTLRVIADDIANHGPVGGAMLVFQPSYDNLAESVLKFQATKKGAKQVFRRWAELAAADLPQGTTYQILEGKERGGCLRAEEQRILSAAGITSAGLCKAKVDLGADEKEEKFCPHYDVCPVIKARQAVLEAQVIFAPTAFLTANSLPVGLEKHVAGLVADERVFGDILRWDTFPVTVLEGVRAPPRTYAKRDGDGVTGDDLILSRNRVAAVAAAALRKGEDPALAVFRMQDGPSLVEDAIKVVGRAQEAGRQVHPMLTLAGLKALAERPTGSHLRQEWRFWKLIHERLEHLKFDANHPGSGLRMARGERDMRIQSLDGGTTVRISWRAETNFHGKPTLLLDASADANLTSKLFGGREVRTTHVDARLNLRTVLLADSTWATSRFRMDLAEGKKNRRQVAENIARARDVVTTAATLYGYGRLVVGAPLSVRTALMTGWGEPNNVDWLHYGAIRGLDFAREHLVALSLGRHEFPVRVIDALVAALTYDDVEPELPIDRWGDGMQHGPDGKPIYDDRGNPVALAPRQVYRTYPLRDGGDVTVAVSEYEGRWARVVQAQFREEELSQFAGRLRPVYRLGEAPLWIAGSKVLPDGFVVDDVVSMSDLADPARVGALFGAIRRAGVTDPAVLAERALDARLKPGLLPAAVFVELGLAGADVSSRWAKGMVAVKATVDGVEHVAQVPAYAVDPVAATVTAYRAAGAEDVEVEVLARGAPYQPGHARGVEGDRIAAEVGTREHRADMEALAREEWFETVRRIESRFGDAKPGWLEGGDVDVQIVLLTHPEQAEPDADEAGTEPSASSGPDAAAAADPSPEPEPAPAPGPPPAAASASCVPWRYEIVAVRELTPAMECGW